METTQAGKQFIPNTGKSGECDTENSIKISKKQTKKQQKLKGNPGADASAEQKDAKGETSASLPLSFFPVMSMYVG